MIDFSIDANLAQIVDATARFAQNDLAPRQREFESARGLPPEMLARAAEMGLDRGGWAEHHGGSGLNWAARTAILAELAKGDAGAAIAVNPIGICYDALAMAGGDAWVERFLGPSSSPELRAVLLHDERNELRGYEDGAISGSLPWVNSDRVDLVVLLHASGTYVLTEGYTLNPVKGLALQAAGASSIAFSAAPVQASVADTRHLPGLLARMRLHQASLMLGVLEAASLHAREYALQRVAFGKPIAHHQALAFLLVDMNTEVEQTRLLIQEAAARLDAGDAAIEACTQAFIQAHEAGAFVGPNAVQVLGAAGFMRDYPVEKYMRELTALALAAGGADAARETLLQQAPLAHPVTFLLHDQETD